MSGTVTGPASTEYWLAWKADVPLDEGEEYSVVLDGLSPNEAGDWSFTVGPPNPQPLPAGNLELTSSVATYLKGEEHCCRTDNPGACDDEICFTEMEGAAFAVRLTAGWFQQADPQALQFVYSACFFNQDTEHRTGCEPPARWRVRQGLRVCHHWTAHGSVTLVVADGTAWLLPTATQAARVAATSGGSHGLAEAAPNYLTQ